MDEVLKRRVIGAAVLIAAGVLIPVIVVKMATPSAPPEGESVTVYEITPSGETRAVTDGGVSDSEISDNNSGENLPSDTQTDNAQIAKNSAAPSAEPNAQETQDTNKQTAVTPKPSEIEPEVKPQPKPEPKPKAVPKPEPKPEPVAKPEPKPKPKPEPKPEPAKQNTPAAEAPKPETPSPQASQSAPPSSDKPYFIVQVGSFGDESNAIKLTQDLQRNFPVFYTQGEVNSTQLYRVRVGPFDSREAADIVGSRLREKGLKTQTSSLP